MDVPVLLADYPIDVLLEKPRPVSSRYFSEHRISTDMKAPGHDQSVLQHSNGLCVVSLAAGHPIIAQQKKVVAVNFRHGCVSSKPSGKKKLNSLWINELSPLCDVECEGGDSYVVYGAVRGNLYETNNSLKKEPNLLATHPNEKGFVAIIAPKKEEKKTAVGKLMTLDEYQAVLTARAAEVVSSAVKAEGVDGGKECTDVASPQQAEVDTVDAVDAVEPCAKRQRHSVPAEVATGLDPAASATIGATPE